MKHFGKTIQVGVALAVLDLCRKIWFVYTGQHSVIPLVFSLIAFPVLLRGVSGLRRGDPEGGVLGAGAGAFFAPLGLVCLLGCLLSRDRLLREACAAGASVPPVPEGERTATEAAEASTATDGGEAEQRRPNREWTGRDLWSGLAGTLLLMGIFAWLDYRGGGWGDGVPVKFLLLVVGYLLSVVGVILLLRGSPAGGMLGIMASAFFVPLGLICLVGCIRLRDKLLMKSWAAQASDPSVPTEETPAG